MRHAKGHTFATRYALDAAGNREYSPLIIQQDIYDARTALPMP
jgi:hypothetical protein